MSPTEDTLIHSVANTVPCIIVLGRSLQARVDVTNWILGEDLLPLPGDAPWHTVLLRYGARNRITVLDETGTASPRRPHFWKLCVPVTELEWTGPVSGCGGVDVRANHPLLHTGARLAVGSWLPDPLKSYELCTQDVAPIIVFAVQGSGLTDKVIGRQVF